MTVVEMILILLALYVFIGIAYGLRFVLSTIRIVDPVAAQASLKVRILFLPGTIALWPIVIIHARARKLQISESTL